MVAVSSSIYAMLPPTKDDHAGHVVNDRARRTTRRPARDHQEHQNTTRTLPKVFPPVLAGFRHDGEHDEIAFHQILAARGPARKHFLQSTGAFRVQATYPCP